MVDKTFEVVNGIIKEKVKELRRDYEKLKAVDDLLSEEVTDAKKHDLLNSILHVQDVQSKAMDVVFGELSKDD